MTTEIIRDINSIKNSQLKADLREMSIALSEGKRSTWKYAYHLAKISNSKSFIDDFGDKKTFAAYLGMSPATVSQYVNAVKFAAQHEYLDVSNPLFDIDITVKNAYLLSSVSDLTAFELYCEVNGIDMVHCTSAELTKVIAAWKASLIPMNEPNNEESEENAENTETKVDDKKRDKVIQKIIKLMYDNGLTLNDIEAAISESVEA